MNGYLLFILSVLLLGHLLDLTAALLNLRRLSPELPAEFVGVFDDGQYARSQAYTNCAENA